MKLVYQTSIQSAPELLIIPLFLDQQIEQELKKYILAPKLISLIKQDFENKPGATHLAYTNNPLFPRLLLVGLGSIKQFDLAAWRQAVQTAIMGSARLGVGSVALLLPKKSKPTPQFIELTAFAAVFGSYSFKQYKHEQEEKAQELKTAMLIGNVSPAQANQALARGVIIGNATNQARSLANHPGNVATPQHLATHARQIAKLYNFTCRVLNEAQIEKEKLGLLKAVSLGSNEEPRFIILEYGNKKAPPVVLIGKGLTFDSGGISIKPADRMEEMKYDMAGGATVLGVFEAVTQLKLPVHLVGLIPAAENLASGQAVKPGDIIISHAGLSVEVINTDAEGRMVLADAISFAKKYYTPRLLIDYATLTGAVVIALGNELTGYFSNAKSLEPLITNASEKTGEGLWPLPLLPSYEQQLKSSVADIKNTGDRGEAGAITGALFLKKFVGDEPWVHFDIAGTAWTIKPRPYLPVGATGWGVYLTIKFLQSLIK